MNTNRNEIKGAEGFFKYREHEADKSAQILRSSTLFYAVNSSEVQTEFWLFNYWILKREISGLTLKFTVRTLAGKTIATESGPIDFTGARRVLLSDLLKKAGHSPEFEGAVEIEVLSPVNMVVPYPAIIVRFSGADWHSMTHSYSRILSRDSGDTTERMETFQNTCEGNWTIHDDPGLESFFVVHNGPRAVPAHTATMTLINHLGEKLRVEIPNVTFAPFETRVYYPHRMADVSGHMKGLPGTIEVSFTVIGVFPRLMSGSRRLRDGAMAIDHSNFNYNGPGGHLDTLPVSDAGTKKPLGFIVPLFSDLSWNCFADVYPSYPGRNYEISAVGKDLRGNDLARKKVVVGAEENPGPHRINLAELARTADKAGAVDLTIKHATHIPKRFHIGIHYVRGGGMPAHSITGPEPYTFTGMRSFWFPVMVGADTQSFMLISNQVFDSSAPIDVVYRASLFNATGSAPLVRDISLKAGETLACPVNDIFPEVKNYLKEEPGWIFMKADKFSLTNVQYIIQKGDNSLAIDHSF